MRAPLSWLRDYAPFDQPVEDLVVTLSSLGLVVEGVTHVGADLEGVVVAHILDIRRHPDADRIQLVDVDWGAGDALQIACGATNMKSGDLVPLATIGTTLPGGMTIQRRKMRGEWSNGMLCSPSEINVPEVEGVDGLLILPPGLAPPGTPVAEALGLTPDVVFDLDITPNRPDALCMAGVARDLAAGLGVPWSRPTAREVAVDGALGPASIRVEAPDLCPRFTATVLTDVPSGPSPTWLARRLTLAGMRPISLVVDVSNYVMLDVGQPNHAYDLGRLGGRGILVRRAAPGETLVTLDGAERRLLAEDCVIGDADGVAVGVGGIMGGASSEISDGTSTVLLEAAWFNPLAIARTGKRLGLNSEARARFERGVDPEIAGVAVDRFVGLLAEAEGGARLRRGATLDVRSEADLPAAALVAVRTERVNDVLGTHLDDGDIRRLLEPIGFEAVSQGGGVHDVTIPTWRPDSSREIDVIEEVARLHGYRRIERTVPDSPRVSAGLTEYQRSRRRVREILAGAGLSEAWTTTFLAPGDLARAGLPEVAVEVENPLDQAESILRTDLLPGLLKAARFNADRQESDVRLFEVGHTFAYPPEGDRVPDEHEQVAALLTGPGVDATAAARLWAVVADALRLETTGPAGVHLRAAEVDGLHPTRSAQIQAPGARADQEWITVGGLGEVDPEVVAAFGLTGRVAFWRVDLPTLLGLPRRSLQARPISRYPASDIDLAFVVDESVPAAAVGETLRGAGGELVESVRLFDVYRDANLGARRRSLTFRLRYRAQDRTLADTELAAAREREIAAVVAAHGGELRVSQAEPSLPDREIVVDGAFNFRDLGGYRSAQGGTVKWRTLFRSDGLYRLSEAGYERLGQLGIRTVIDLRTQAELALRGQISWAGADRRYHHLPMMDVLPDDDAYAKWVDPEYVAEQYVGMLDQGRVAVQRTLELLADEASYPVVFHCMAGKDRTGIIAALVLRLLGVAETTVVADYARSAVGLARLLEWVRETRPEDAAKLPSDGALLVATHPETMQVFLGRVDEIYGGPAGYLDALGLPGVGAALRRNLLTS